MSRSRQASSRPKVTRDPQVAFTPAMPQTRSPVVNGNRGWWLPILFSLVYMFICCYRYIYIHTSIYTWSYMIIHGDMDKWSFKLEDKLWSIGWYVCLLFVFPSETSCSWRRLATRPPVLWRRTRRTGRWSCHSTGRWEHEEYEVEWQLVYMIKLSYVEWNGNINLTFMIRHLRSWIDFENEHIPWFNGWEHVEHLNRKPCFFLTIKM